MKHKKLIAALILSMLVAGCRQIEFFEPKPQDMDDYYSGVITDFMDLVDRGHFDSLQALVTPASADFPENLGTDFLSRNKNIYTGIGASNIRAVITDVQPLETTDDGQLGVRRVFFHLTMDTSAGPLEFDNNASVYALQDGDDVNFLLEWTHGFIFPSLKATDKVQVPAPDKAVRGTVYDRSGRMLAGNDRISSVCLVPAKMAENPEADIARLADFLEMAPEEINTRLNARPMADENDYVELKRLPASSDITGPLLALEIPGVLINSPTERVYPYGAAAAHLTGYMQAISAEELEQRAGQGYNTGSKIGKAGVELLLEERLKGSDGQRIIIVDADGNEKQVLAERPKVDGEDITLTIDMALQSMLHQQMQNDKGAAVVMNHQTGEVLALLSTPSYDPNSFILGWDEAQWAQLNSDERQPMYNRFKASVVPGSSFKPIIAAVGLQVGAFGVDEDFGSHGRSWQPDSSWGNYTITTLVDSGDVVTLGNAMINSDNIYFSKAALKIGAGRLATELTGLGFGEEIPFMFGLQPSTFGKDGVFEDDIELADSGHGQGRVLVNPLHMATMLSSLCNDGDMLQPYLEITGSPAPTIWKQDVFSPSTVNAVTEAMVGVVEDPAGTAHAARVEGVRLAGKTGTGEIKAFRGDESGTEIGWFCAFNEADAANPLLFVGMVEDVKGRGGSAYLLPIGRSIFSRDSE